MKSEQVLDDIGGFEELGRVSTSRREARRARERRILYPCFLAAKGERELSSDRLSIAPMVKAVRSEESIAQKRQEGSVRAHGKTNSDIHFEGWAVIQADAVRALGCDVLATPHLENPYHADIVLPVSVQRDDGDRRAYAQKLAVAAIGWRDRPPLIP